MTGTSEPTDLDVERVVYHAERPGFRITEIRINALQEVPWHRHTNIQDTFYVLEGRLRILLRDPDEQVELGRGETWGPVVPGRAHRVSNAGEADATFLVLQGIGAYDFLPAP
jgi:quercetin dioxygenase-like cupin family protein